MKYTQLFEDFLNEGKSFQFSFNYNTDEDDVEYIQDILMNAGVDAIAEPGTFDDEMIVKAPNAVELRKAKKAIQADGFEINESTVKDIKVGDSVSFTFGAKKTKHFGKVIDIIDGEATIKPKPGSNAQAFGSMKPKISIDELVKESVVNETVNVKDIKVGTILNFKDVESLTESQNFIGESKIGDIHIMAGEADSFTGFRKAFMDEYGKPKSVKELKSLEAWLQTIWNENQTNESELLEAEKFQAIDIPKSAAAGIERMINTIGINQAIRDVLGFDKVYQSSVSINKNNIVISITQKPRKG